MASSSWIPAFQVSDRVWWGNPDEAMNTLFLQDKKITHIANRKGTHGVQWVNGVRLKEKPESESVQQFIENTLKESPSNVILLTF
jgi:hypothetical protein